VLPGFGTSVVEVVVLVVVEVVVLVVVEVVVLVVVEGAAGATVAVPLGEPLHVSSIDSRADSSEEVTVRLHRTLMSTHVSAYWHQYAELDGFHSAGPREPLERLAEAVTAMRC